MIYNIKNKNNNYYNFELNILVDNNIALVYKLLFFEPIIKVFMISFK